MPLSAKQYVTQLLASGGVPADQINQIVAQADAYLTSQQIHTPEEFQSMQGRVQAEQRRVQEYTDWYNKNAPIVAQTLKRNQELEALVGQRTTENDGSGLDSTKYLTREDFEKANLDLQGRIASVVKTGLKIASAHAAKFGEQLDVDAVEEIATKRGIPLEHAYQEYIRPRVEASQKETFEKETQRRIDEALAAERAKRPIVQPHQHRESAPILRRAETTKAATDSFDKDALTNELASLWQSQATEEPAA